MGFIVILFGGDVKRKNLQGGFFMQTGTAVLSEHICTGL
jgi:hypothetical protein